MAFSINKPSQFACGSFRFSFSDNWVLSHSSRVLSWFLLSQLSSPLPALSVSVGFFSQISLYLFYMFRCSLGGFCFLLLICGFSFLVFRVTFFFLVIGFCRAFDLEFGFWFLTYISLLTLTGLDILFCFCVKISEKESIHSSCICVDKRFTLFLSLFMVLLLDKGKWKEVISGMNYQWL